MKLTSVAFFVCAAGVTLTAESRTTALATTLTQLLMERNLEAFAAQFPDDQQRFAAVLYVPTSQLLAISGTHTAPTHLHTLIRAGEHRRVYMDLSTGAAREGRVFVQDLAADGLSPTRRGDAPFDITWRNATQQVIFNGNWKEQNLSRQAYEERFESDENAYAAMLELLVASLQREAR